MKQLLYIFFLTCSFLEVHSQVLVFKKTAQRRDDFVNNAWKGKDSFLFSYNNDTIQTSLHALQFTANNTWDNWFKYTYTLSAVGKVTTQLRENWVAGNWVNNSRYTYSYDGNNNVTEILYDTWSGGNWTPTGKITYTGYNAAGLYQTETVSGYSGGAYSLQSKHDKTYVNNQVTAEEKFLWSIPLNNWAKLERLFYTYTQNEISSITRSLPDTAANWALEDKYLYNYNLSPFQLVEFVVQIYDTAMLNWQNKDRVVYSYIADSLLDKTQNETFGNNTWNPTERAQYIYNGSGEKIEYYTETFNGNWNKALRSTYNYVNTLLGEENKYTGSGNNWVLTKKLSYAYDANQNRVYESSEDHNGANFTPVSQTFYYYSSFSVGIQDKNAAFSKLILYPNPATDKIHIQLESQINTVVQINILDIFGKTHLTMTQPVTAQQNFVQIPCSSLSSGFYYAQIIDLQQNKQQTEKFQIQK